MTIDSIFARASSIASPSERAAFLDEICACDLNLRREIDELLAAHASDNPLDRPAAWLAGTNAFHGASSEESAAAVGDQIGPYKLRERIGEGGMGEVWVADQLEPIRRRVALKLIKPGMDSRQVLARFEQERQALALMDHPNIAKVLDAGATPTGRPYFAMELVRGTAITDFCDARKLSPRERLALFVPVCQAVQHAHQKGIIHRDLKPANVLVELHDDLMVPKVIDFGVAKAVGSRLTDKTIYTGFGSLLGTPTYMAPEQATFNAIDVDTRADVYALGVMVYELLAGSPPIEKERFKKAALDEVLRIVRDEEPPRPSHRLSTSQSKAAIAATRKEDPERLSRLMRGELDWIVMKALEKDRARRYESPTALAKDLSRYLDGEAVEACPPRLSYRLLKTVRRHKKMFLGGTAFLLVLAAATGVSINFGLAAKRSEALAEERRVDADRNAANAIDAQLQAQGERNAALSAREALKRSLYAASMNLVASAWESDNIQRVHELLDEQRPKSGEADLRGFEWYYWNQLARSQHRTWRFHEKGTLGGATLSGNGGRVAFWTFGEDKPNKTFRLHVRDVGTSRALLSTTLPRAIVFAEDARMAFSKDGKRLAFAFRLEESRETTRRVVVFDVDSQKQIFSRDGRFDPKVALSADGRRLAILVTADGRRRTSLWSKFALIDLAAPDQAPVEISNDDLTSGILDAPEFSPDGARFMAVSQSFSSRGVMSTSIHLWNVIDGKRLLRHTPTGEQVVAAAFAPDGSRLISVGVKNPGPGFKESAKATVTASKFVEGGLAPQHSIPTSHVLSSSPSIHFSFSPDGRRIAMSNAIQPTVILDLEDGSILGSLKATAGIAAAAFSTDGTRISTLRGETRGLLTPVPDGTLEEWNAPVPVEAERPPRRNDRSVVWGPDRSRRLAFLPSVPLFDGLDPARSKNPTIEIQDASGKQLSTFTGHSAAVARAEFSPDGRLVLSSSRREAVLWRVQDGKVLWQSKIADVARSADDVPAPGIFSPDGRWIALHEPEGVRVATNLNNERFKTAPAAGIGFSPDGLRFVAVHLVTSAKEGHPTSSVVDVWDMETGTKIESTPTPDGNTRAVTFSADGRWFAVVGSSNVLLFNSADGRRRTAIKVEAPNLAGIVFSPDGERFVLIRRAGWGRNAESATSRPIVVYDASNGAEVCRLKGHATTIRAAAFSPDGRRIATSASPRATLNGEVRLWDAESGSELLNLSHQAGMVGPATLIFSPDGGRLTLTLRGSDGRPSREVSWSAEHGSQAADR